MGFDAQGIPHLRIEHRVVPAGPSIIDTLANMAFYYGAVTALCEMEPAIETRIKFDKARDNFYAAARLGLRAQMSWTDQQVHAVHELIEEELLPLAESGLMQLGVAKDDRESYLDIIAARVCTGMNGANWQRAFVAKHGADMTALTAAYIERQESGEPVHEWTI